MKFYDVGGSAPIGALFGVSNRIKLCHCCVSWHVPHLPVSNFGQPQSWALRVREDNVKGRGKCHYLLKLCCVGLFDLKKCLF